MTTTADSMCFRHPAERAAVACDRCGTFCCGACFETLDGVNLCGACFDRLVSALQPLMALAKWARTTLHLFAAAYVVEAALTLIEQGMASLKPLLMVSVALSVGFLLLIMATVFFFSRWFYVAVETAAGRGLKVDKPAVAAATLFIPLVNFVRPFTTIRKMLAGRLK
jgi:hypothetical protein